MNNQTNNEQQTVPMDQVLSMRITRVEKAEKELAAAKMDLYSTNYQAVAQMVTNNQNQMAAKIEELESAPKVATKPEKPKS